MSAHDLLKRNFAPILPEAWEAIDAEAARILKLNLAARKIVDFQGPFGWRFAAVNTGRLEILPEPGDPDLNVGLRSVQPVLEIRVPIKLPLLELDQVARGAANPNLEPVVRAAEKVARAEDRTIFGGFRAAGIVGILGATPHRPLPLPSDMNDLPRTILAAEELLRQAGVTGPFALVLGSAAHDAMLAAIKDGYPIAKRIDQILGPGRIVRAAGLDGGVLLSVRGGDYELTVGQDLSIGYAYHDKHELELYIAESFTFRVLEPAAAVPLGPRP